LQIAFVSLLLCRLSTPTVTESSIPGIDARTDQNGAGGPTTAVLYASAAKRGQ
jgi:hypothetical protein